MFGVRYARFYFIVVIKFNSEMNKEYRVLFLMLILFAVGNARVLAQRFDPNTRYRISVHGHDADVVDNARAYIDDINYSLLACHTKTQQQDNGSSPWWYIRRSDSGGWTIQNAVTGRYIEMRTYRYSYDWYGQHYSGEQQELRSNPALLGDSSLWSVDYIDGAFRFNSVAMPSLYMGVYVWSYGDDSGYYLETMRSEWMFSNYIIGFDITAEDGTPVGGEGTPSHVFSSMHLNGKTPMRFTALGDYLVTVPERAAGSDCEIAVTWDDGGYAMRVDGADPTATGFVVKGLSCNAGYPFTVVDDGDAPLISGTLWFTTLPVCDITASGINGSTYVMGKFRMQDPDNSLVDTTFTAEVKVRGATAQRYPKKPYNVKLRQADGSDQDANLLGLRNTHTWVLDAMYVDRIRMRNRVCFDTWNEMDTVPYATNYNQRNGTVGRFVEVFVNGEYQGLYCFTDKVNRKLLNLTKVDYGLDSTEVTPRGLLYKGKQWGDDTYLYTYPAGSISTTTTWGNWELEYPDDYPSAAAWTPLRSLINYGKMSEARFVANFEQNYYFGNLLNYVMLQLAYNLEDNGMKNMYVSTKNIQKAGRRMLFTVWDMDSSLGGKWDGQHNDIVADTTYVTRVYPLSRLFSHNSLGFRDSLRLKWHDLRETTLSPERLSERLEAYASLFETSGAWAREYNLWGASCDLTADLREEIQYVNEWYARNITYLDELLPDLPTGLRSVSAARQGARGIYTPDGRRIDARSVHDLPPGIYIIDGRKVIR